MIYHACVPSVMLKIMRGSKKAAYVLQHLNFTGIKKENQLTGKMEIKRLSKSRYPSTWCIKQCIEHSEDTVSDIMQR